MTFFLLRDVPHEDTYRSLKAKRVVLLASFIFRILESPSLHITYKIAEVLAKGVLASGLKENIFFSMILSNISLIVAP